MKHSTGACPKTPVLVILGPTGSGKSELALAIAEAFKGEIVNCDSVQIYDGFNVGAAKLWPAERRGIAHHLIDIAGPGDDFTAGDYARQARSAVAAISSRGHLPIVCGGTGLYLRALLDGLSPAPPRSPEIRTRLSKIASRRPFSLHRLLARSDPAAAARIHANDHQKLIRALEIGYLESSAASAIQSRPRNALSGYQVLKIGLDPNRSELRAQLDARCSDMFQHGLIEETRALLGCGYHVDSKPMQSLGYRQAAAVIWGTSTPENAILDCQAKTRQYAKRQMTWFRAEEHVHWLRGFGTDPEIVQEALRIVSLPILWQRRQTT